MGNSHLQRLQRGALIAGVSLLLLVAGYGGVRVHDLSQEQKALKRDYSLVNNVSFGILSVNEWRDLIVRSVSNQIENFRLDRAQQDSLEKEIEVLLNALIDKADSMMNRPQKSVGGKLRKLAFNAIVKPSDLHKEVPGFAHKIMQEVMRPRSKERLSMLARSKLEDLGRQTYDSTAQAHETRLDSIFRKYAVGTRDEFNRYSAQTLQHLKRDMYTYVYLMLGALVLLISTWYLARKHPSLYTTLYLLSIGMALIFLITGLTSIMIEIDARIDALDFHLMGETISFRDQVLFFQSKSIVDVVALLIHTGKADSMLVGVLILCFSIFFPLAKLTGTGLYVTGKRSWTKSRLVTYFALHSGKWSMADVMVVAIFMAYIGFNGIMNDQMGNLNIQGDTITSIATNRTSLQPGYIIFVGFVLFGLLLSQILQWITAPAGKSGGPEAMPRGQKQAGAKGKKG